MSRYEGNVFYECGDGWLPIIEDIVGQVESLGGKVSRVKEKFGGLDIYYDEPIEDFSEDRQNAWDNLQLAVSAARTESMCTCEICGKPGVPRTNNRWIKTLCDEDGLTLGYKAKT